MRQLATKQTDDVHRVCVRDGEVAGDAVQQRRDGVGVIEVDVEDVLLVLDFEEALLAGRCRHAGEQCREC